MELKIPKIVGFMLLLNLQVLSIYLGLAVEDKKIEHYMCAELVLVSWNIVLKTFRFSWMFASNTIHHVWK